jgi:uncharacterized protein (TIGR02145 family)
VLTFTMGEIMRLLAAVLMAGLLAAGCGGNKDTSATEGAVSKKSETFADDRDGQKYRMVRIGDQTWMAENLRFNVDGSWCYENSADSCDKYGRLYDWDMAMSACPNGWQLPSRKEWRELVTVAGSSTGGAKLKSESGWKEDGNGTDSYGFSALPGGRRGSDGRFRSVGKYGYWWTAAKYSSGIGNAYYRSIDRDYSHVDEDYRDKSIGYSVRCVKEF